MRLIQIHNLYDRAGRRRKLIIRFSILSLGAFFLAQVIPTLADEHSKVAEVQAAISPSPSPSESTSNLASPTPISTATDNPLPESSPSPTPVQVLSSQDMSLKFPLAVEVDPRALTTRIPLFSISGPDYLLACVVADRAILDVVGKGSLDDQSASNLYLSGDLTSNFVMSGPTVLVSSALNSFGGLKVSGLGVKLTSTQVHFSFVALDGQAKDGSLCSSVKPVNARLLSFKPIGLGLGLKKGVVNL